MFILFILLVIISIVESQDIENFNICYDSNLNSFKYCNWFIKRYDHINSKNANSQECQDIILSNHMKLTDSIIRFVNNVPSKDISFNKLVNQEKSFKILVSFEPEFPLETSPIQNLFAKMIRETYDKFCIHYDAFRIEFTPKNNCNLSLSNNKNLANAYTEKMKYLQPDYPPLWRPWCVDWNNSAVIGSIECGIAENGQ